MTSKTVEVRVPITEQHYVGWAKIKTNWTRTDVITGYPLIILLVTSKQRGIFFQICVAF